MWVAVIGFAFLGARLLGQGRPVRDIQGFFVGALIFPVLVGVVVTILINRRRPLKMSPAQKNSWTAGIALVISFIAFAGASPERNQFRHTDPKKETARLLAEASGKSPVRPDSDWWDDLMRDFFRSVIERNKRYSKEVRELDRSAIHHLYSTESYSTKSGMQRVIAQLQAILQLDQKYATGRPLLQDLEMKLRNADVSESEKSAFLEGARNSAEVFLGSQDKLLDLEQKWVTATITLYQFAIDHRADYVVKGKKLVFKDDSLRLEFVAKQADATAQRRAFLDEKAGLVRLRNNMMTEIGLASQDLDTVPSITPEK